MNDVMKPDLASVVTMHMAFIFVLSLALKYSPLGCFEGWLSKTDNGLSFPFLSLFCDKPSRRK